MRDSKTERVTVVGVRRVLELALPSHVWKLGVDGAEGTEQGRKGRVISSNQETCKKIHRRICLLGRKFDQNLTMHL